MTEEQIWDRNHELFVRENAEKLLAELSREDIAYMKAHPDEDYHFSLGLRVHNRYIHGKKLPDMGFYPG